MFAALLLNGSSVECSEECPESVAIEFDTDSAATHRCRACGEELAETVDGYESLNGDATCSESEHHDPEALPLSWCNNAAVRTDEAEDSVTVSISVGDPRGAFTFTVRRISEDCGSELAGCLVLHVPYAEETAPHMALSQLHEGTYLIGTDPRPILRTIEPSAA